MLILWGGEHPPMHLHLVRLTNVHTQPVMRNQKIFRPTQRLQKETVARGGFYWQMIQGKGPEIRPIADQQPSTCHKPPARNVSTEQCKSKLRKWCTPDPAPWQQAHLYLVCPASHHGGKSQNNGMADPDTAEQATAEFLLTRPTYAWIGYVK